MHLRIVTPQSKRFKRYVKTLSTTPKQIPQSLALPWKQVHAPAKRKGESLKHYLLRDTSSEINIAPGKGASQ